MATELTTEMSECSNGTTNKILVVDSVSMTPRIRGQSKFKGRWGVHGLQAQPRRTALGRRAAGQQELLPVRGQDGLCGQVSAALRWEPKSTSLLGWYNLSTVIDIDNKRLGKSLRTQPPLVSDPPRGQHQALAGQRVCHLFYPRPRERFHYASC